MGGVSLPDTSQKTKLGRYSLLEKIGEGGFGTLYRARNDVLGNEVAIKVLKTSRTDDQSYLERFHREAREAAKLDHPNIVRILDLDEISGIHFIVMEFVRGGDLMHVMEATPLLEFHRIQHILTSVAAALDYAHGRGMVHRDVKPSNILLREDGLTKLSDFGTVKVETGKDLTRSGETIGTPAYMAPEQLRGHALDGRCDLYALGVVAFEMFTGRPPFESESTYALAMMHIEDPPPRPSTIAARVQEPLESVLLKALTKNPDDRYATSTEFTTALDEAIEELCHTELENRYAEAQQALARHDYTTALARLTIIREINPAFRDVQALFEQTQLRQRLAGLYAEASDHLQEAETIAAAIQDEDPHFPDDAGVLRKLSSADKPEPRGPRAALWPMLLQAAGGAFVIAGYMGYWRVTSESLTTTAWGYGIFAHETILRMTVIPAVALVVYVLVALVEWRTGRKTLATAVVKTAVLAVGAALTWWLFVGYFEPATSTGALTCAAGLTLAMLGTLPQTITAVRQRQR